MLDPQLTGRSVVVRPGQTSPPAWAGCERVSVSVVDSGTADRLLDAWRTRTPIVIELGPGLGLDDPTHPPPEVVTESRPWEWTPNLRLVGEELHFGAWANSVDARSGGSFRWADAAVALGATAAPDADVLLPDGTPALVDGGPLDAGLSARLGLNVIPSVLLERGRLAALVDDRTPDLALAPDQLAAVTTGRAGSRVIAPAGSGKTRVLTERARHLITGWGLPPASVAVVAYNVRASKELQSRLSDVPGIRIRTLNALSLKLAGSPRTIDEPQVRSLLRDIVPTPKKADADPLAVWLEAFTRVRMGLKSPAQVESELPDVAGLDEIFPTFRAALARAGVVDFDEQVMLAITRLLTDAPFRHAAQRSARVLLVDEFQDLTPAHVLLLRVLSGPGGAVYGVGDDDQTIYGYSGASPRWLVDFDEWFPGGQHHELHVNYRCAPAVVEAATNLLTRNRLRVPKVISARPDRPAEDGALTVLPPAADPFEVSSRRVCELVGQGVDPADIAVLCRVNALLAPIQVLLRHAGVPVGAAVGDRFLRRSAVRAALAWLELSVAPEGSPLWSVLDEAARRPKRGMSEVMRKLAAKKTSVAGLRDVARWYESKNQSKDAVKMHDLADDVAAVRAAGAMGTGAVLRTLISEIGLAESAAALDGWSHGSVSSHQDDLAALEALAHLQPDPAAFGSWLADELGKPGDDPGVTVASVHAVKGQEWPHVVVHHVSAGLLPHRLVSDVEEERRVLHVAITRSAQTTTVVSGPNPSPFLPELSRPGEPPPLTKAAIKGPPSPATPAKKVQPADVLVATPGVAFYYLGRDYEVTEGEVNRDGVPCREQGGSAVERLPLGQKVFVHGTAMLLGPANYDLVVAKLQEWRRKAAAGKPADTVLSDATLNEIALRQPANEAELSAITGIGPAKLESYGDDILRLLSELR